MLPSNKMLRATLDQVSYTFCTWQAHISRGLSHYGRCLFCISITFICLLMTFLSLQQRSGDLLLLPAFLLKRHHISKMKVAVYEEKTIYKHSLSADCLLQKLTSCASLQSLKVFLCPAATEVTSLTLLPSLALICVYFI